MKVANRRDNYFRLIIFNAIFISLTPLYLVYRQEGFTLSLLLAIVIIVLVTGLLLWVWHGTFYKLENGILYYKSGPFKGKIPIQNITHITINTTLMVGLKFGLARNGFKIESTSHVDLYISPKEPRDFLRSLVSENDKIKVVSQSV